MGTAKKNLKATKKFEKKHLKGVLDKRKATAKIKQRQQIKDKKKARRAKDAEFYKGPTEDADGAAKKPNGAKPRKINDMSVDDFFQGGFDDIIDGQATKATKPRKRKRGEPAEKDAERDDDSASSIMDQPVASDSDDDGGRDDVDNNELGMSKEAMDGLADRDPEFYNFLKENDPEALDFDQDADLAEVDELSAGEDEEPEGEQPKKKRRKGKAAAPDDEGQEQDQGNQLTRAIVASWRKAMVEKQSLRAARQVVLAFRCAAHLNEGDGSEEKQQRWTIDSPDVFNDIVVLALKQIPLVMNHHLPVKESAAGRVYVQTESKKFKTLTLLLKSFTSSIMHLLSTLSDDKTLKLTLSSLTPILPYLLSFKKLVRALAKSVVNFWAQPASSETTRITAFLVLRRLVAIGDKGIRETVLKATYQGLVQGCRVTNHNTIQGINLMKNSAAELWGIDAAVGYTTAFTLIRQLAIHLRNSIVHNKNESFRMVYNWQFTHSLDFWSRVLAEHCSPLREAEAGKESQLRLLIYPLVQVTLGAMRLMPSSLYLPLRFHLVRSLLRTSRATGTYIPLASPLLEVLSLAEMKKAPKASTLKAFDFAVAYKATKAYLGTRVYQDGVGEQVVELLGEYMMLWSKSIAFPELALPVVIQLKRWLKQARSRARGNKNAKLGAQLVLLVQKLEANAGFVEERRAKVDFAPRDRAQVDAFLRDLDAAKTPLGAYVVGQRRARDERTRMLDEARREDERKRREEERDGQDAGSGGEDEGESEDDAEMGWGREGEAGEEGEAEDVDEGSEA